MSNLENPEDVIKMLEKLDALTQRLDKLEGQSPNKGLITTFSSILILLFVVSGGISLTSDQKVANAIHQSIAEAKTERREFNKAITAIHITLAEFSSDFRHLKSDVATNTKEISQIKQKLPK